LHAGPPSPIRDSSVFVDDFFGDKRRNTIIEGALHDHEHGSRVPPPFMELMDTGSATVWVHSPKRRNMPMDMVEQSMGVTTFDGLPEKAQAARVAPPQKKVIGPGGPVSRIRFSSSGYPLPPKQTNRL